LRGLRGYPVIVNKWGSWCPPCRQEFPVFQRVAAHLGRRVAFLGDDVNEASVHDAVNWLARFPLTYPSFSDHSNAIANLLGRPTATYTPVTYFYNARGRQVFYHDGPYVSVASLEHDIRFYLGG
jgi:cytochrome c biogenesis protein CcmG/thiol:disulfide interchange protein DsbE